MKNKEEEKKFDELAVQEMIVCQNQIQVMFFFLSLSLFKSCLEG